MQRALLSKTKKLFYGKYPYRAVASFKGAHVFRKWNSMHRIQKMCASELNYAFDKNEVSKLASIIEPYRNESEVRFRSEGSKISIYTTDKGIYDKFRDDLKGYIVELVEPGSDAELTAMQEDKKLVVCNKLPHNKYQFKVTLKNIPVESRPQIHAWLVNNNHKSVRAPYGTIKRLLGVRYMYGSNIIYVRDAKSLTMLQLLISGYVKKIEEYILRCDINTKTEGELIC